MKLTVAAAVVAVALAVPLPVTGHGSMHQRGDIDKVAKNAWTRAKGPKPKHRSRYRHIRANAYHPRRVRGRWRALKRHYKPVREAKAAEASLPYEGGGRRWAIPWEIVACESGGNFRARNGVSTAGGAYQIIDSTWEAYGGTRYADRHPAAVAPEHEQHAVASRIWAGGAGRSQWEC